MSDDLWRLVGDIAHELGYDEDKRGAHSVLIREMVGAVASKWRYSPYVCTSARLVVLVNQKGEVFYWLMQVIKLNSERQKLPCFLEMKPEKKIYYQSICPEGVDQSEWFRAQWLFNYFAVWQGKGLAGKRLSHSVDRSGIDSKMADLSVNLGPGRFVTREVIAGFKDYVQWDEGGAGYDRADFPIDIPTYDLKVIVVVDEGLYRNTLTSDGEISGLALEFRNRELARFSGRDIALYPEVQIEELSGRSFGEEGGQEVFHSLMDLKSRVSDLMTMEVDGSAVISEKYKTDMVDSIEMPRKLLFYVLGWRSPQLGVEVCVRWEKPSRGA
jgi:hypothetical protein